MSIRIAVAVVAVAGLAGMGQAHAQYYPHSRPPGYGYDGGPPGSRCNAFIRTYDGPRRVVCPMGVAKPVGTRCHCPPPGPDAPPARGRVVP